MQVPAPAPAPQRFTTDPAAPVSVVVADDAPAYRAGMVRAIAAHPRLQVLADTGDGTHALTLARQLRPDLLLLDIRMPGLDGVEVCRRIAALDPPVPTRCVILTAYAGEDVEQSARDAGACECLSKSASRADICAALLRAASVRA